VTSGGGLRAAVFARAAFCCEYCHIRGWEIEVEHIVPRSPRRRVAISPSDEELNALANLAAACAHCNRFKGDFVTGEAVVFGGEHRLFNPRSDQWDAHFAWSADYLRILPLNGVGDATIQRLNMNDPMLRRQRELLRRAALAGGSPWP
jgi:HNH endonuclease